MASRHVESIVWEREKAFEIAVNGLASLGYSRARAHLLARTSILLWNIVSSWYKSRLYSSREEVMKAR